MSEIEITKEVKIQNMKSKKKQLKHSNFYITINTNQQFKSDDDPKSKLLQQQLKDSISHCFNNIKDYIVLKDKNKDVTISKEWIKSIDLDGVVEVGEKYHQPHAHLLIHISHYTYIHFNYQKLKEEILENTGLDTVYVYCKLYKDARANLKDYINKKYH